MGLIVGLSGVDGSGKTTVAKLVIKRLQSSGQRATYHHELDFLLLKPIFKLFTNPLGSKRAEIVKEHIVASQQRGNPVYSDIYYTIVWLDSLVAYLYFKLKRGIIIHDRWLYDLSVTFDYKHYENRLVKKLFTIFPRPDIFILLTVPDEVAHLRKRDDAGHIHHDVQYYRVIASRVLENAHRGHCDGIIDANRSVEEVADDILAVIRKITSNRLAS